MIRLIGILIAAGLLAGGIAWIADRQGELLFTLDNYEIHMSAAATIGFAALFTALIVGLARLITTLITSPGTIGAWFNARRTRRGNDSLSHGLLAVAAGDVHEARRHADRARGILGTHPLALLLQSQAALRLLYYFPKETASLISERLRGLDVRRTAAHGRSIATAISRLSRQRQPRTRIHSIMGAIMKTPFPASEATDMGSRKAV